jgi:cytidylate kinase
MDSSPPFSNAGRHSRPERAPTRSPWAARSAGPFVTISREASAGGASLARLLARKLTAEAPDDVVWQVFEDTLSPSMLKFHHLPTRLARFFEDGRISGIQTSIGETVGHSADLSELVEKTNGTMRDLAARGHVILVGRGANFATAGLAHGVHVRLVASKAHRARYLTQMYDISDAEALTCNATCDAARHNYVEAYFKADDRNPTAYDLVINTELLPLAAAAKLVASHIRAHTASA